MTNVKATDYIDETTPDSIVLLLHKIELCTKERKLIVQVPVMQWVDSNETDDLERLVNDTCANIALNVNVSAANVWHKTLNNILNQHVYRIHYTNMFVLYYACFTVFGIQTPFTHSIKWCGQIIPTQWCNK